MDWRPGSSESKLWQTWYLVRTSWVINGHLCNLTWQEGKRELSAVSFIRTLRTPIPLMRTLPSAPQYQHRRIAFSICICGRDGDRKRWEEELGKGGYKPSVCNTGPL